MRFLLGLAATASLCVSAAHAETMTGYAYYPSEKHPEYLLKLSGKVVNGKVAVKEAFLTPKLVAGSVSVTAAGQKIGMDGTPLGHRVGLGLQVNVNKQLGFNSTAAEVLIFYPSKLTSMPNLSLKAKNETLKSACKRDAKHSKPDNVEATITIPPELSKKLDFGDALTIEVKDESNNALEQATFKICPKQAYNQMLAAAIQSVIDKDAGDSSNAQKNNTSSNTPGNTPSNTTGDTPKSSEKNSSTENLNVDEPNKNAAQTKNNAPQTK
ncbi:MAG: hypothetical protein JST44_10660 [Cyanobacteria bacterium SZAS LIN-5]|nr:hypothetical protein [Cyanobacteria bacterium SZAS LIN-5]